MASKRDKLEHKREMCRLRVERYRKRKHEDEDAGPRLLNSMSIDDLDEGDRLGLHLRGSPSIDDRTIYLLEHCSELPQIAESTSHSGVEDRASSNDNCYGEKNPISSEDEDNNGLYEIYVKSSDHYSSDEASLDDGYALTGKRRKTVHHKNDETHSFPKSDDSRSNWGSQSVDLPTSNGAGKQETLSHETSLTLETMYAMMMKQFEHQASAMSQLQAQLTDLRKSHKELRDILANNDIFQSTNLVTLEDHFCRTLDQFHELEERLRNDQDFYKTISLGISNHINVGSKSLGRVVSDVLKKLTTKDVLRNFVAQTERKSTKKPAFKNLKLWKCIEERIAEDCRRKDIPLMSDAVRLQALGAALNSSRDWDGKKRPK